MRFPGTPHADRGKRARFSAVIAHGQNLKTRFTAEAWVEVPLDAEPN
jgi:hypothetical protein